MIATQSTEAAAAPARATVVYLPHEKLHECILNPRKEFKPGPLEELSRNIEEMGVKQPLLVRPSRTAEGQYEIIAGARRWRGNGMALDRVVNYDDVEQVHRLVQRLGELPCMVEDMSDVQAREFMLVENLQREDLTVVEEADGYADLLTLKGEDGQSLYTVAKIAERIGRSESHVTQRLKLRRAPKRLLEACERGVVGTRHCELVGRIPDMEAREELTKAILAPQMRDKDLPLNVRETVALIRRDYMLSLKGCGFDVDDAELLPVEVGDQGERLCGGACMGCPFRSGNDASLQEELKVVGGQSGGGSMGVDPHVCTKPSCFRRKQEAAWKLVVASAEGSGKNVLSVQGAKAVFVEGSVRGDSEYVDLAAKPRPQDVGHYDEDGLPKWEQVVKGSPCQVTVTVARNPETGKIHHLVKRDEAIEAANQAAKSKGAASLFGKRPAAGSGDNAYKLAEKKRAEAKKAAVAESYEALNALGEAVVKRGGYGEDEGLVVLLSLLGLMTAQGVMVVGKALKLEPLKRGEPGYQGSGRDFILPILEHYKAAGYTRPKLEAYVVMCLAGDRLGFVDGDSPVAKNEPFLLLARTFGVDMDAVKRLAKVDLGKGKGKMVEPGVVDAAKMADRRVALEKELVDLYVQAGHVYDDDDLGHTDELVKWLDAIAADNGLKAYSDPNHGLADAELIVLAVRKVVEELRTAGEDVATTEPPKGGASTLPTGFGDGMEPAGSGTPAGTQVQFLIGDQPSWGVIMSKSELEKEGEDLVDNEIGIKHHGSPDDVFIANLNKDLVFVIPAGAGCGKSAAKLKPAGKKAAKKAPKKATAKKAGKRK